MAFRISEYACGPMSGRTQTPGNIAIGLNNLASGLIGPIQSQYSTAFLSPSSFTLSGQTRAILVDTDIGGLIVFASSGSTSPTVTSTNGQHIMASVGPILFYVQPNIKIYAVST